MATQPTPPTPLGDGWAPVTRATTYELVLDQIRSQLQSGRLRAGDRLPSERDLAAGLGVSRVAVREAIGVLKALGVARTSTGSGAEAGTFLHPAPADALTRVIEMNIMLASVSTSDVVNARISLERESARLTASHAKPEDWDRMREHLAVMADQRVSVSAFNDHDTYFHVAIARASGNPFVAAMTTALRNAMRGTLLERLSQTPDFRAVQRKLCSEHEGIFAALEQGLGPQAADLVEAHIRDFYQEISAS